MKLSDIPDYVASDLRNRGHSDDAIERMTPCEVFTEHCEWDGLIGYGKRLYDLALLLEARAAASKLTQ